VLPNLYLTGEFKVEHKIRDALHRLGQLQLLTGIETFSFNQLKSFLAQLQKYDPSLAKKQKELLLYPQKQLDRADAPCSNFESRGNPQDHLRGEELMRQGKVGCLILAGGQGTRLGFDGPKGLVPVTPIKGKSLFQLFSERARAASVWAGKKLPLCIMTSALNHAQTLSYFQMHHHFGLDRSQLAFFEQEMLPFMDDYGNWLLERPGVIAEGPDGNGHALRLFFETGIWEKWSQAGIEYLNLIFVDNPLADPFDPEFTGFTARTGVDAALKAVQRLFPNERMGVLAERQGKLKVIEYSEIPVDTAPFTLSSTGMFCISMAFIQHLCQEVKPDFPLHLARRTAKVLLSTSKAHIQQRFIFDLLDYARSSALLVCPREKIYSPLKNATGEKSLETVKQALLLHDQETYHALTGLIPPAEEFELDPAYYYPSDLLKQKLRTLSLPHKGYITPE
jgi:UDP-N-acetylglucosamine/UDP-N-acetylgalactosamine diphosphorylase